MAFRKETPTDLQIKTCIEKCQSFSVIAGAGSGKTESLVKALVYIRTSSGKKLRALGQQVACITYTNAAVEVIKRRTDMDELFAVSTIHSFLWSLVANYQADIRTILKNELIPQRIAKKQEDDNGGNSQKAIKAREQIASLTKDLENLLLVKQFDYDDNGRRDYSIGRLDHDDIIDLASLMISRFPTLRKIIGQKYPYIFIDEAQDTFYNVMEALNLVAAGDGLPIIGYFGDPMQQIYDNRAGEFKGPENAVVIKKPENYRCSTEVIKLLNALRPDLQQTPGEENAVGSVEIRLTHAEVGEGPRKTYTKEQLSRALKQFDHALHYFGWEDFGDVKQLFLTRQMIAQRLGFSELNRLFTGKYASKTTEDTFSKGEHYALKPFMDVLIPLMEAHEMNNRRELIRIMRKYSPLLNPKGESAFKTIQEVTEKAQTTINDLAAMWYHATIKEILVTANRWELFYISERLAEQLNRSPRTEVYDEILHEQEKGDWLIDEFLTYTTNELAAYRKFVLELTPYSTQHGTKGDEFEKVLVVFDDTEAGWNNYSFSRLLTPHTAGKDPTEGQRQRSLNLAYVCFSRALKDLRIILFTDDPQNARRELIKQGLFADEQVSIQLS